jgi:hypothetical protein
VSALIAYTQTKWWIITRYLLIRILRPVQLPDSGEATSLHRLSQAKAIKLLILKEKRQDNHSMISVSPFFGAASIFNILLFIVLGTITPYYLTDGSGPATVRSQTTDSCNGFEAYSIGATRLAYNFYEQCQLNPSADASICGYLMRIVNNRLQPSLTLDSQCPFAENNCEHGEYNKSLRIEYLDMQPSDYGLNADWNIRQSHSLTCAPVKVRWFQLPYVNATVFWIGYPPGQFNMSETHASIGEAIRYWPNALEQPGPLKFPSFFRYERKIYSRMVDLKPFMIIENFHPGLKSDEGDTSITILKLGVGLPGSTPFYSPWREVNLTHGMDETFNQWGAATYALGCIEQYQLCYDSRCTGWSNASDATSKLFQILAADYDHDVASGVLKVQSLLIEASTLHNFMQFHFRAPVMAQFMWRMSNELRLLSENSPNEQWQWEVQSWFEMAYLTTKFSFLASAWGEKQYPGLTYGDFSNTSWICDKLLFLDNDSTNVNFIGLVATSSGLLVLCLVTFMGRTPVWLKQDLRRWSRIRVVFQRLWRDLLHDLALVSTWFQGTSEVVTRGRIRVFGAVSEGFASFAEFFLLSVRRFLAHRSRHDSYQEYDTELD